MKTYMTFFSYTDEFLGMKERRAHFLIFSCSSLKCSNTVTKVNFLIQAASIFANVIIIVITLTRKLQNDLLRQGNCLCDKYHSSFHGAKIVVYRNIACLLRKVASGYMKQQKVQVISELYFFVLMTFGNNTCFKKIYTR